MSVATITKVAAVRAQGQKPTRRTVGKGTTGEADQGRDATITDLLVSQIPTELVAPYTVAVAAVIGASGSRRSIRRRDG